MSTRRTSHQTEPSANNALAVLLRGMLARGQVLDERTGIVRGHAGLQPDIVITAPGRAPVVIEAEYMPAATVEKEATDRLGLVVKEDGRAIEAAIALRYPAELRDADELGAALRTATLSYAVFTEEAGGVHARFPESGWLDGAVEDVADLARLVSVPQRAVDQATELLQQGIDDAANVLSRVDNDRAQINIDIANRLGMTNVPQTRRMAGAILANALIFHERLAGRHAEVRNLAVVCGPSVPNPKGAVLAAWDVILDINYWPIFGIAKEILELIPADAAAEVLRTLRETAEAVGSTGIDNEHDLTGRIFQNLIADRKYLATFYTRPASAALLARLAVAQMDGVDWSDADSIGQLRIADFACGTGALLSAVYEQIASRYERAGGDPVDLHTVMMEDVLAGCDVMPSAIHITGSTLSGREPTVEFRHTRLYTLEYGRQSDGTVKIGSLELLNASQALSLFPASDPGMRVGARGEVPVEHLIAEFPDESQDLIIMNPPFTRATNHEGAHADITNPAFAAFGATPADQTEMGDRVNRFGKGTAYHGNAGIASAFVALADKKLKPGGVLALVLPLSVATGVSWQGVRLSLAEGYSGIHVMSLAVADSAETSFSADTVMAECLIVARKDSGPSEIEDMRFTSLNQKPNGIAGAAATANSMALMSEVRALSDGPYGGTPVLVGNSEMGNSTSALS